MYTGFRNPAREVDCVDRRDEYVAFALKQGADHAAVFDIDDIAFDPRTILKCMYGCGSWGYGHTCPSRPGSLLPWEYEPVLRRYRWGIIVHSTSKILSQSISYELERKSFQDGYYFSFSLSDCSLCEECLGHQGMECIQPEKARPSFHSVGIDVFRTARKFGFPLEVLKREDDPQNWYSAVFIE